MTKKTDGDKSKKARRAAAVTLAALVGKKYSTMSKAEQEAYHTAVGQFFNFLDDTGAVKPV